ncbi:MAG TPA: nucleotidyltransferase family protein [Allosphingosinicella sp.]|jgi:hypothetical protein
MFNAKRLRYSPLMHLQRAFQLLCLCCRWPRTPALEAEIGSAVAAGEPTDWDLLVAMAARHRVEPLVHDALRRAGVAVPAAAAERLAAAATGVARRNLSQAAEALRLSERLQRAGLAHLFVKGVTLNLLAYGTLALKHSSDIDLLVEPEGYAEICRILIEDGYRCTHPGVHDVPAIVAYAAAEKDSVWRSDARSVTLEVHQRLTANPMLLPALGARSPAQGVTIAPGVALRTLARDELFAYLCVHGALTAWSRLKWLADLAAFISSEDERGIERLYRRAAALAPRRAAAQALLLAHRLLALPLSGALEAELRADRVTRYLERAALATMTGGGAVREVSDQPFGPARLNLSVMMLQPGWRYKAAELGRKLPHVPRALRGAFSAARAS